MITLAVVTTVAALATAATIADVARDGHGRVPTRHTH